MLNDLMLNLQLFADGGADGGSETGETVNSSAAGKKQGEYANVVFGKQSEALTSEPTEEVTENAEEQETPAPKERTPEEKQKDFLELVKGEYKDIYTQETQKIINKRFKETKTLEDTLAKYEGLMDNLKAKYNVTDFDALTQAIDNDNAAWEERADEAGMTTEQYKAWTKVKQENEKLRAIQSQRQAQMQADAQLQRWNAEAEQIKAKYPDFNLEAEVQNETFQRMLKAGVPMEHAYKVNHFDDIVNSSVTKAAETTEKAVVENIRAKGSRPSENASMKQSPFIVKNDVTKLTRKDRAEAVRRAQRGDIISF